MFSSFTKDEKKLFLFFLSLLAVGAIVLPFVRARHDVEVFPAGHGSVLTETSRTPSSSVKNGVSSPVVPTPVSALPGGKTDLNAASLEFLESLPGIGPSKAAAIVAYRQQHGPFRSLSDLDRVHGIGPALIARLSACLIVVPQPQPAAFIGNSVGAATPVITASPSPAAAIPVVTWTPKADHFTVNINTATAEQLATLKHIGPVIAQRIVEYRGRYGPFRSPEALDAVKGVGRLIIEENRNRMTVR